MTLAITFPGQGSQQPGAGMPWRSTPQWSLVEDGSDLLERDLAALLLDTSQAELTRPWEAQVSTYLVSMMCWNGWQQAGLEQPAALAGHSLGEWTALAAAQAVTPLVGLQLVSARGSAMADAASTRPGGMAALLGADDEAVENACAVVRDVWPANYNAPGQVVISGDPAGFAAVGAAAGARRVLAIPVGGAYHTPFMEPARAALVAALADHEPAQAVVPIWCNIDASAHTDAFAGLLAAQLTAPVRWHQTVTGLLRAGVDSFVELGPGTVLTTLAKRTAPDADRRSVSRPEELS